MGMAGEEGAKNRQDGGETGEREERGLRAWWEDRSTGGREGRSWRARGGS